ncbi:MAG TPA: type I 3-dehydroquinate dehydratase [Polyangiaceae bacterium]|nr:type I 3-dehydroquinate dehydratase [Polyangiaceae bacterium]
MCVSIRERSVARMGKALEGIAFAELRLDSLADPGEDLGPLFDGPRRTIATCREGKLHPRERDAVLRRAMVAGARSIDVEWETPSRRRSALIAEAARRGVEVIVSSHLDHTPDAEFLRRLRDRGFAAGADIVKIACAVRKPSDNAVLLGLIEPDSRLVVIGLGRKGLPSRLLAPLLGAEFTFALPDGSRPNALGQLPYSATLGAMHALRQAMGG